MRHPIMKIFAVTAALLFLFNLPSRGAVAILPPPWFKESSAKLEAELTSKYGEAQRPRLKRGLEQVGRFWRAEDGDAGVFEAFVRRNFAGDQATLDTMFDRFQRLFEKLDGHMTELRYEFRLQTDLDRGPLLPLDETFAGYEPAAHLHDDFFGNKLAFVVLLNFPLTTLEQRLAEGDKWTRRQWAETRLAERFAKRVPAEVTQAISEAVSDADLYVAEYKICMHHLLDAEGRRLFPPKLKLLSHWNLRDEIKAQYSDPKDGLARQRLIQRVMERIIDQSIPQVVINNPRVDWNPVSNEVRPSPVNDFADESTVGTPPACKPENLRQDAGGTIAETAAPEPDTRYAKLLNVFLNVKKADPYSPTAPTLIARRFEEDRQMSEARVRQMLEDVLTAPEFAQVGRLIAQRLGRPLEPFDIWYNGFRPRGQYTEAQLDEIVRKKYPTAEAFRADLPNLLQQLGFSEERARFLQAHIDVEPARGSGHAMGAGMRGQKVRLRTRVPADGMDYKGFNIAIHELGHNIEQIISLNEVDLTLLAGVPNTAFTEALAMLLQGHDLELLGLAKPDAQTEALQTLNDYWATAEIAGVALVDMAVWHWMYDHPTATPAELKAATMQIARDIWNRYYAPVFGMRDVTLLAIYSHMINSVLYLPDYPIGHLIGFQLEEQMKKAGNIGSEFERMTRFGNVAPDLWMKNATGAPVGAGALLAATKRALAQVTEPAAGAQVEARATSKPVLNPPANPPKTQSGMNFFDLIKARRSIRAYKDRAVEEEKLTQILNAARQAPSAGNLQAYRIVIVRDATTRAALSRAALHQESVARAPVVLAFFADPPTSAVKYGRRGAELYSIQDATIACTYAQLAVTELGLGSVWIGAFDDADVKAILKTPADWRPVALLPIGYPAESPAPTPRRPLKDLVKEAEEIRAGRP